MAELPAPTRKVLAQGPVPISQPRGSMAVAQVFGQVSQQADNLRDTLFNIGMKNAQREGTQGGNALVFDRDELGRIIPPKALFDDLGPIPSRYDEAFKAQVQVRYEQAIENDAHEAYKGFALDNPDNPDGFNEASEGYRSGVAANVPESMRGAIDDVFSRLHMQHIGPVLANEAEAQRAAARFESQKGIDRYKDDAKNLFNSGANPEEIATHRAAFEKDLRLQGHLYNDFEIGVKMNNYDQVLAGSMLAARVQSTSLGGLAAQKELIQSVMDGTYALELPGHGKTTLGQVFNQDRLDMMASRLNSLHSHNAQMRNAVMGIQLDQAERAVVAMRLTSAMTGEPIDMQMLMQSIGHLEPAIQNKVIGDAQSSNALNAQILAQQVGPEIAGEYFDTFEMMVNALSPEVRDAAFGNMDKDWMDQLDLMAEADPGNARKMMVALGQRVQLLTAATGSKSQQNAMRKMAEFDAQRKQMRAEAEKHPPHRQAVELAAMAEDKLPNDADMERLILDNTQAEFADWSSTDEETRQQSDDMLARVVEYGFVPESLVNAMDQTMAAYQEGGDPTKLLMMADRFNSITSDGEVMRERFAKQMGPDKFQAWNYFLNSGRNVNSPELWNEVREIRKTGTLAGLSADIRAKKWRGVLSAGEGKEWKKLPDETKVILDGDFPLVGSDKLPATPKMQGLYKETWVATSALYGDDRKQNEMHHAGVMAILGDEWVESTGAWDTMRNRGFNKGADGPLPMYVHKSNAPETYYSEEGGMDLFAKRAEAWASTNLPGREFKYGENLFVTRTRFLDDQGTPTWHLQTFDDAGQAITLSDKIIPPLSIDREYRELLNNAQKAREAEQKKKRDRLEMRQRMQDAPEPDIPGVP